eukprot:CAMPEP_0196773110 /NCGR_PEP_ID=MMETSP1104-20130614/2590_1 /TAXON_ID=33652 /ORGANISM="Cafeteria sp., Strain Caron Lab Isolate" /LENGTH=73 /DNA_ID=CAMNT_0042143255 /DNA_START=140 /DNA_END=358 /DNA_ORIENTATION=+
MGNQPPTAVSPGGAGPLTDPMGRHTAGQQGFAVAAGAPSSAHGRRARGASVDGRGASTDARALRLYGPDGPDA